MINLTTVAAKVYNALHLTRNHETSKEKSEYCLEKSIHNFTDFDRDSKAFDSLHRGKKEQILWAYGLPKETVI